MIKWFLKEQKMIPPKKILAGFTGLALAGLMALSPALAEEFVVEMLNKGTKGVMVFEPDFVQAQPGDTIKFVPTDKGHNVESIKGFLPDGVKKFRSKPNVEYVLTVDAEGLYGIKCTPHYAMGMVALISVGEPVNLEAAKKVKIPKKPRKIFKEYLAQFSE